MSRKILNVRVEHYVLVWPEIYRIQDQFVVFVTRILLYLHVQF